MTEEAKKSRISFWGHNYPGSEWYIDSYALMTGKDVRAPKEKKGFLTRAWNSVF